MLKGGGGFGGELKDVKGGGVGFGGELQNFG